MTGVIRTRGEIIDEMHEHLLTSSNEILWEFYIKMFPLKDITLYDQNPKKQLYRVSELHTRSTKS